MITVQYDLGLDIRQDAPKETQIILTNGDVQANKFNIRVYDGSSEVDYTLVDHAWIIFVKPDNTRVQGILVPAEHGYTYTLGTNEIAAPGTVLAAVLLYGTENERISTSRFKFTAQADLITGESVVSSSQYDALTAVIVDLQARIVAGEFTGPVGPQGVGFEPKGTFATLAELQAAHPVGTLGDQYIVGDGEPETTLLYIWSVDANDWASAGRVAQKGDKGDTGATGATGETGPAGEAGTAGADGFSPYIDPTTQTWHDAGGDTGVAADTVLVVDTASTTKILVLADNTEYRLGTLTSMSLSIPVLTSSSRFNAQISFTAGASPSYSDSGAVYIAGSDDITSGLFTPVATKRYNMSFWWDGVQVNCVVKRVTA